MVFEQEKFLLGKNSADYWYIINLSTGAKVEYDFCGEGIARMWLDEITENDITRAKQRENLDISFLYQRQKEGLITEEEYQKHYKEAKTFISSEESRYPLKKVNEFINPNLEGI